MRGVYREVVEPERIVFTGADSKIGAGADSEAEPGSETVMTITFADQDGKTLATANRNGLGAGEEAQMPGLPDGTYTVELVPGEACVAKDGVKLSATETFLPSV